MVAKKYTGPEMLKACGRAGRDGERRGVIAGVVIGVLFTVVAVGAFLVAITGGMR